MKKHPVPDSIRDAVSQRKTVGCERKTGMDFMFYNIVAVECINVENIPARSFKMIVLSLAVNGYGRAVKILIKIIERLCRNGTAPVVNNKFDVFVRPVVNAEMPVIICPPQLHRQDINK
ncbi:hypothetical protein FACS189416_3860 [Bacteroidia bacterium]|nr:hypothetical protein FACS189416_3860 [Bacteroidia bacterium]